MPEGKPPRAMGQLGADLPQASDVSTTIVGGQPPKRRMLKVPVSAAVERALYLAAIDPAFREELLRDRDEAARRRGLTLSPSELAMLRLAPAEQLAATIDGLDTSPPSLQRRRFMQAVAVGAAALAAGAGCGGDEEVKADTRPPAADAGVTADIPQVYPDAGVQADIPQYYPDAGVLADIPVGLDAGGIQPDLPPSGDGDPFPGDGS